MRETRLGTKHSEKASLETIQKGTITTLLILENLAYYLITMLKQIRIWSLIETRYRNLSEVG